MAESSLFGRNTMYQQPNQPQGPGPNHYQQQFGLNEKQAFGSSSSSQQQGPGVNDGSFLKSSATGPGSSMFSNGPGSNSAVRRIQSRHFDFLGSGAELPGLDGLNHPGVPSAWANGGSQGQIPGQGQGQNQGQRGLGPGPSPTSLPPLPRSTSPIPPFPGQSAWLDQSVSSLRSISPRPKPTSSSSSINEGQSIPSQNGSLIGGSLTLIPPSTSPSAVSASSSTIAVDDELIPTAIVIKNIPFAIKKEQLLDVMTSMGLPLPYAFNYHFDSGVFRGLAFANFTTPEETGAVISNLNGREIGGRKLRVEYKKMLPLAERERIEREKRERRGQLEEQHRSSSGSQKNGLGGGGLPNGPNGPNGSNGSTNNGGSQHHNHNSNHHHHNHHGGNNHQQLNHVGNNHQNSSSNHSPKVDLNDPETLEFYSQILLFRDDKNRSELVFPGTLLPHQRKIVAVLSGQLGLLFTSDRLNGGPIVVLKQQQQQQQQQQSQSQPQPLLPQQQGLQPPPPQQLQQLQQLQQPLLHHQPEQQQHLQQFQSVAATGANQQPPPPGLFDYNGGNAGVGQIHHPQPQYIGGGAHFANQQASPQQGLLQPQPQQPAPQLVQQQSGQLRGTKSFADIRAPATYPYNISAPGTPTGSPFFPSQTPPPGSKQNGPGGNNPQQIQQQQLQPQQPQQQQQQQQQPPQQFLPLMSLQQQQRGYPYLGQSGQTQIGFQQQQQQQQLHQSPNQPFDLGNSVGSLSDSFSTGLSLGGGSNRPHTAVGNTGSVGSSSPTASVNSIHESITSSGGNSSAGVIGSKSGVHDEN